MLLHMQTNTNDLITTKEASDILGESVYTTIRRVPAGELTPVKKFPGLRGAFVFDRSDVLALKTSLNTPAPAVEESSPEVTSPIAGASLHSGDAA
jgi:hypothetical protein